MSVGGLMGVAAQLCQALSGYRMDYFSWMALTGKALSNRVSYTLCSCLIMLVSFVLLKVSAELEDFLVRGIKGMVG